ncbi:hypothetical protein OF829_09630 [Sphingomonas sp. LB-2]|uniref:tetratricopeptide repeat protein n=1 Tax=Sphingomonas caeni TaxID=2984949 RepID=UPI0022303C5F|nr:hypothetical protein [Sphingomonas caeni]MCW3847503.1 hypothetical protein [Sphingomonas caeni]
MRWSVALMLALLAPLPALAQKAAPDPGIVVEGQRGNARPIPMSDWYVAETPHVLVYAKSNDKRIVRIAHNLEKLHFLLSMLFNRVDEEDDTAKLRVTLIGDSADFGKLGLANIRWQQGPYPRQFPTMLYYDPREDGAVLATSYTDQKIMLEQGQGPQSADLEPAREKGSGAQQGNERLSIPSVLDPPANSAPDLNFLTLGEEAVAMTAEGRLYAGFAQHYLLTYFPAAYPRWYLDGIGEIFSTVKADQDGVIEYGHQPEGFRAVTEKFGNYPIQKLLDGTYLTETNVRPRWTPYRAWQLAHLLFFSDEWKEPLHNYLAAVARGAPPAEAMTAFGDLEALRKEANRYYGRKAPYERLIYPADRAIAPLMRQLNRSEAAYVEGKLEMGARLEIPAEPGAARDRAIRARDAWLADQRATAARYPTDLEYQLLVAEADCRTGHDAECLAIAERVLALSPERSGALLWKGVALTHLAIQGPQSQRKAKLREARTHIVRANRADTEAVLPLIAFYRSYADAGEPVPDMALQGLMKACDIVPSSPTTRLMLGEELARRGDVTGARRALLPVAAGAYDSPERARAQAVLARLSH